ncbi:non-ribosomal peptide synthetase [Pseudoalteromonas sp. Of7M-16]|uniref:non-ribosomal peptide synthetase n=1 Tax=Pseudoalteromonas sp. Of7M-16 TaxID=2917756 RepID=UPI001EF6D941|nr:non-ribosomal peptide synthetase [Pseudoalteromonas sp. Of7M-16]MCG7548607.1 amino acid adenylation domain-containing protein [Pseudoalteromonas sp. Of7M-16]
MSLNVPNKVVDAYPLSKMQDGLLFHYSEEQDEVLYHDVFRLRISGKFDEEKFVEAIAYLLDRHPVLRTAFELVKFSKPMQLVYANGITRFDAQDISKQSAEQQSEFIAEHIEKLLHTPFDLSAPSQIRFSVVEVKPAEFQLFIDAHHIILDGWSMASLISELLQMYLSLQGLCESPIRPQNGLTYRDFVKAELLENDNTVAKSYWQEKLSDHEYSPVTSKGESQKIAVSTLSHGLPILALERFCEHNKYRLKDVLMAAYLRVAAMLTSRTDTTVTSVVNGRLEEKGAEHVAGLFVNLQAIRADLSSLSWRQLIEQVIEQQKEQMRFRRYPFANIVQQQNNPISDFCFNFVHFHVYKGLQGIEGFQILDGEIIEKSNFKVSTTFNLKMTGELDLLLSYDKAFISTDFAERICGYFQRALEQIIDSVDSPVMSSSLLSAEETTHLLYGFNGIYPQTTSVTRCLHQEFEAQVEKSPDAIAVVFNNEKLTYQQLNCKANQLAQYLKQQHNIGPDSLVGLCVERSTELILGTLAILKAGGAYVPLDIQYSKSIITKRINDVGLQLVITKDSCAHLVSEAAPSVVNLSDWTAFDSFSSNNLNDSQHVDTLAYILSTSGSTGEPKLISMPHKPLVNMIQGMRSSCAEMDKAHSVLQFSSIAFDMSFTDIFLALLQGGTLHMIGESEQFNVELLVPLIIDKKISMLNLPYPMLQMLACYCNDNDIYLSNVEVVISTAALLIVTQEIRRFFKRHSQIRTVNQYGPSETHVCTSNTMSFDVDSWHDSISIGSSIANTHCYVLDQCGNLAPFGVNGELYIGGDCVSRGYLNNSKLTEQRYVRDPFAQSEQALMYRSGDIVRWLSNGELEYVSRADDQVKIRGFRVEIGAIDTVLSSLAGITDSCVIADVENDMLIAYFKSDEAIDLEQMKNSFREALPDYMVPGAFVAVSDWPLTVNGKVDKRKLPPVSQRLTENDYQAPETELEILIAGVWQTLLDVPQISRTDDFFSLGGHSILATRLAAVLSEKLGTKVALKQIFMQPVLSQLASAIESLLPKQAERIERADRDQALPLSYAQQRLWLLDKIEGQNAHYNIPAVLTLKGTLNEGALVASLQELVNRHEVLRTVYRQQDSAEPLQSILSDVDMHVPIHDVSEFAAEQKSTRVEQLIELEKSEGFNLQQDLMLRAHLIKTSACEHLLLVTMHHIASDGWSLTLFINEFCALYQAKVEKQQISLSELPIQYADYAAWQRQVLQGETLSKQVDAWQEKLQNLPVVHQLPLDFPRPEVQTFLGKKFTHRIDKATSEKLYRVCESLKATLFMGLHASFSALLSLYSKEEDIVVGSPIANREQAEVADLIGFFVNTLVLRSNLSGQPSFLDLIAQSKEMLLFAYEHQQVPFEQLVEALHPERSVQHSPLFQIMLTLQNNDKTEFNLPQLDVEVHDSEEIGVKYDLALNVSEDGSGLLLEWEYNTELFAEKTIERMGSHFERLIASLVEQPELAFSQHEFTTDEERIWQARVGTGSAIDIDSVGLGELFERQVASAPNQTALIYQGKQTSYAELSEMANSVAHRLVTQNKSEQQLVGVLVERSELMVASLLGVLKSGAAYVPLDPSYPVERLDYIIEHAGISCILTTQSMQGLIAPSDDVDVICVDQLERNSELVVRESRASNAEELAYVIYTSGSTGKPKGVQVTHGNIVNFFTGLNHYFAPHETTQRWLAVTSICFDISVLEIFWTLCQGHEVVLMPEKPVKGLVSNEVLASLDESTRRRVEFQQSMFSTQALSVQDVQALIIENNVTHLQCTPSFVKGWNRSAQGVAALGQLQALLVGGEGIAIQEANLLLDHLGGHMFNMYGPTETTVWSSISEIKKDQLTIGQPIVNTQFYVLDKWQKPVPQGHVGELLIGGLGVTSGYYNSPELSAQQFVSMPNYSPSTLYKTGDLVRVNELGQYEFVGRLDSQVKVNGYRIELGEIERVLQSLSQVKDGAVLCVDGDNGNKRLLAFAVTQQDSTDFELRSELSLKLANYMVPEHVYLLDSMPLTPNGKTDKKSLYSLITEPTQSTLLAPESDDELQLASICADVLGVEVSAINMRASFFEVGGHSLLATQFVASLNAKFGIELTMRQLFELNDLASLSKHISDLQIHKQLEQELRNLSHDDIEEVEL